MVAVNPSSRPSARFARSIRSTSSSPMWRGGSGGRSVGSNHRMVSPPDLISQNFPALTTVCDLNENEFPTERDKEKKGGFFSLPLNTGTYRISVHIWKPLAGG